MYAVVGSKTTDVNVVACKMKAIQRVKTVLILLQIISNWHVRRPYDPMHRPLKLQVCVQAHVHVCVISNLDTSVLEPTSKWFAAACSEAGLRLHQIARWRTLSVQFKFSLLENYTFIQTISFVLCAFTSCSGHSYLHLCPVLLTARVRRVQGMTMARNTHSKVPSASVFLWRELHPHSHWWAV